MPIRTIFYKTKYYIGKREIQILVGIFFLAIVVRMWGIRFGLPYPYHPDEPEIVEHAIKFGTGDLNPHSFIYPTLYPYFLFIFYALYFVVGLATGHFSSVSDFAVQYFVDPTWFYLIARFTSAVLGSLTVLLVYVLGQRLYGKKVGLLSAFFLAFTYLHVELSHYATVDVAMVFFFTLSFYFSVLVLEQGELKHYIGAGLLAGLAASTKYNGGLSAISLLLAHSLRAFGESHPLRAILSKKVALGFVFVLLGFLIGTPYSILDFATFRDSIIGYLYQSRVEWLGQEGRNLWLFVFTDFLNSGMGIFLEVLSLCGFLYCLVRRTRKDALLALFLLLFYLLTVQSKTNSARYWLPIFPLLAVTAARLLLVTMSHFPFSLRLQNYVPFVLALFVIFPSATAAIKHDYLISQKDTRTISKEWIEDNIPQGTRIAVEMYGPPLEKDRQSLLDGPSMLAECSSKSESLTSFWTLPQDVYSATQRKYVFLAHDKKLGFKKMYYLYSTWTLGENSLDCYKEKGFSYLIVSSYQYDRYLRVEHRFPKTAQFYRSLFLEGTLVKEFKPDPVNRPGPTIKIFALDTKNE